MTKDHAFDNPRHDFVTFFVPQTAEFAMIFGSAWQLVACSDEWELELWAMVPAGVPTKVELNELNLILYLRTLARDELGTAGTWNGVRWMLTERAPQRDVKSEEAGKGAMKP
jgi:hypothetical protein